MTKNKITIIVAVALAVILLTSAILVALFYGSITLVEAEDSRSFTLTASGLGSTYSLNIIYFNMTTATLVYSLDEGTKIDGISNAKIKAGTYYSGDYGTYYLFINNSVDEYIVVKMADSYIVFNCETVEDTEAMYSTILVRNPYI